MVKNGKTGETAWRASWSIERWPRTHVSNVTAFYISLILMHSLTACIGYCVPEPVSFLNCEMHTFPTEADLWKCYWSTRVTMAIGIVGLTCYTPLPLKVEMNNSAFQIKTECWIRKIKDKKKNVIDDPTFYCSLHKVEAPGWFFVVQDLKTIHLLEKWQVSLVLVSKTWQLDRPSQVSEGIQRQQKLGWKFEHWLESEWCVGGAELLLFSVEIQCFSFFLGVDTRMIVW